MRSTLGWIASAFTPLADRGSDYFALRHDQRVVYGNVWLSCDKVEVSISVVLSSEGDVPPHAYMESAVSALVLYVGATLAASLCVEADAELAGNIHALVVEASNVISQAPSRWVVLDIDEPASLEGEGDGFVDETNVTHGPVQHDRAPVSYTHLRAHETVLDLV